MAIVVGVLMILSSVQSTTAQTACYEELGCFPMDWCLGVLRPVPPPFHPAKINTRLHCYTREANERQIITLWPQIDLKGCYFNPRRRTAFIVHGYINNGNFDWLIQLKDAYLTAKDANVFVVDWGDGSLILSYLQAVSNTRIVGAEIARFIKWLVVYKGVDPANVHLMGESLGAQICGYVGQGVPGIGRITGMDPAHPGFEGTDKICRLDKDDANFVDIIHTNGLGFGYILPAGHVDFYVNGGFIQPGCHVVPFVDSFKNVAELGKFTIEDIISMTSCSHVRSHVIFTNSLLPNCNLTGKLVGPAANVINALAFGHLGVTTTYIKKCDYMSCIPMGIDTEAYPARGVFGVTTTRFPPYCDHKAFLDGLAGLQNPELAPQRLLQHSQHGLDRIFTWLGPRQKSPTWHEIIGTLVACSHGRSYEYYTATLRSNCTIWCKLAGVTRHILNGLTLGYIDPLFSRIQRCDSKSCIPLGLETESYPARGVFAATTDRTYPFCETDPEVNSRMFREIEEEIEETTSRISEAAGDVVDTVKGVASKGREVVSGAAETGKGAFSAVKGFVSRRKSKDSGENDDEDEDIPDEDIVDNPLSE